MKDLRPESQDVFQGLVKSQEIRTVRVRKKGIRSIWLGFGVFGLIGWSVAMPTLMGVALGVWLDGKYPGRHSWTLTFLVAGLTLGCALAWRWVAREAAEIKEREKE